ncbi:unnamed protein product, partial [Prorocentrum cordatum]
DVGRGAGWMSPEVAQEKLAPLRAAGVAEVLVMSGEVSPKARSRPAWVRRVERLCELALEAGLLPHVNVGPLSEAEFERLAAVSGGMGLIVGDRWRPHARCAQQGALEAALPAPRAAAPRRAPRGALHDRAAARHRGDAGRAGRHAGRHRRGARPPRPRAGGHPRALHPGIARGAGGVGRRRALPGGGAGGGSGAGAAAAARGR